MRTKDTLISLINKNYQVGVTIHLDSLEELISCFFAYSCVKGDNIHSIDDIPLMAEICMKGLNRKQDIDQCFMSAEPSIKLISMFDKMKPKNIPDDSSIGRYYPFMLRMYDGRTTYHTGTDYNDRPFDAQYIKEESDGSWVASKFHGEHNQLTAFLHSVNSESEFDKASASYINFHSPKYIYESPCIMNLSSIQFIEGDERYHIVLNFKYLDDNFMFDLTWVSFLAAVIGKYAGDLSEAYMNLGKIIVNVGHVTIPTMVLKEYQDKFLTITREHLIKEVMIFTKPMPEYWSAGNSDIVFDKQVMKSVYGI